jgi:hypothetical protein
MKRRPHGLLVPALLILATLVGFVGTFAIWANRQALNTGNWTRTSARLLANKKIDDALGVYLVSQLFQGVDVAGDLRHLLPPQLQALGGPASAELRHLANRAAPVCSQTLMCRARGFRRIGPPIRSCLRFSAARATR